jgi:hypothetical protein
VLRPVLAVNRQEIDGLANQSHGATAFHAHTISATTNTALTTTCRRISICAQTANIRFAIGTGEQTASGTSHFIQSGERLDLDVPANAQIAVIRAGSTDGTLELSELV